MTRAQPSQTTRNVNPYVATLSSRKPAKTAVKLALTLPPRPMFPGAAMPQQVQPMGQGASMASGVGAGRPVGSVAPGAAPLPAQTGVAGQPSVASSVAPQANQGQKGFGNTPTGGLGAAKGASRPTGAKAANAQMGYGSNAVKPPVMSPMSMSMPMGVGSPMPSMGIGGMASGMKPPMMGGGMKMGHSVRLNSIEKFALLGHLAGGGIGAIAAPKGNKWEGFNRGVGRTTGLGTGLALGAGTGALTGAGLGLGSGALLNALVGRGNDFNPAGFAGLGGALGGLAGAGYGGTKGWNTAGEYMGPASYDPNNKKPERAPHEKKEEKEEKHEKKSDAIGAGINAASGVGSSMLQGAGMENARSYSNRLPEPERIKRRTHGMMRGLGGNLGAALGMLAGGGLGAGMGALGGAGLGVGADALLPGAGRHEMMPQLAGAGALIGGGAGLGAGGYYGGQLGLHLTADEEDKKNQTDMANAHDDLGR